MSEAALGWWGVPRGVRWCHAFQYAVSVCELGAAHGEERPY